MLKSDHEATQLRDYLIHNLPFGSFYDTSKQYLKMLLGFRMIEMQIQISTIIIIKLTSLNIFRFKMFVRLLRENLMNWGRAFSHLNLTESVTTHVPTSKTQITNSGVPQKLIRMGIMSKLEDFGVTVIKIVTSKQ